MRPETLPDRPTPGARFGAWTVMEVDATGRRAVVRCACGVRRLVACEALLDGSTRGCGGCPQTPRINHAPLKDEQRGWRRSWMRRNG